MTSVPNKKIMIFGRPGSGKSTFAHWLSQNTNIPVYHLDKYFFTENWVERNYDDFISIQKNIINKNCWIVDGNSTRSLDIRWLQADLVLYFNFSKMLCIYRILKRLCKPNITIEDRALNCPEKIRLKLFKYMWGFEERVANNIKTFKKLYPNAIFKEIQCDDDLNQLKNEWMRK